MRWDKGYTASFHLYELNPSTLQDVREIDMYDCTIDRDIDDDLIESASITVGEDLGEMWVRVYLDAWQEGAAQRVPLFTGLTSTPTRERDSSGKITYSADCYSVLKPSQDILCATGYYVPTETPSGQLLNDLLGIVAPVEIAEGAAPLTDYIVSEDGETYLTMAMKIADALGWRIRLDGNGTIHVQPEDTTARETFGTEYDLITSDTVSVSYDWYSCPNVYRATMDSASAVARDDDPVSDFSTIRRGREIWEEETGVSLSDGETLAQYAARKLEEAQTVSSERTYTRRFSPDSTVGDLIQLSYPQSGLSGITAIRTQSISCSAPVLIDEEC